jgi:hypothetical protein
VIQTGLAHKLAKMATTSGAAGATIMPARGTGKASSSARWANAIIPQKEVVMSSRSKGTPSGSSTP